MNLRALALVVALAIPMIGGCRYRGEAPPDLGEAVRIRIPVNHSRLVTAQSALQSETARELRSYLGWQVSPAGSADLELTIEGDDISAVATGDLDIPTRWQVVLHGSWVLTTAAGERFAGRYRGSGHYSGRLQEAQGAAAAAQAGARSIASALQAAVRSARDHQAAARTGDGADGSEPVADEAPSTP